MKLLRGVVRAQKHTPIFLGNSSPIIGQYLERILIFFIASGDIDLKVPFASMKRTEF